MKLDHEQILYRMKKYDNRFCQPGLSGDLKNYSLLTGSLPLTRNFQNGLKIDKKGLFCSFLLKT